jgi:hypothetical protein
MGETAQRRRRRFVGRVRRNGCSGALGGLSELRLGEEFDEGGGDFIGRGLDRHAGAGTELDHARGVELLVASEREQEQGLAVVSARSVVPSPPWLITASVRGSN